MELRKVVSAHDPDQAQAGSPAAQVSDGVESVADADDSFETADFDARIVGHSARGFHALVEIEQTAVGLERVARRHQPPYAVEFQPLDREQADGAMSRMWRIERTAQEAD